MTGCDDDDDPTLLSLQRALRNYLVSEGLSELEVLSLIITNWPGIAGELAAGHTRPRALHDHELVVGVDHPGWATEMTMLSKTILDRVADQVAPNVVSYLKVRVEPGFGLE